jgi:UDP-N-acetylmuramoylalanine--D-glutamate ligase
MFKPKISAILNITEDHLNRHKTFDNYAAAKLRVAENQGEEETCVLNYDDEVIRALETKIPAKVLWFSMKEKVEGIYLENDKLYLNIEGHVTEVIGTRDIFILGRHNIENVMSAILMAYLVDVPLKIIQQAVKDFKGVAHRIQYVETVKGVTYYNDSKATNPDAAIKAIEAMIHKTVLIAGGMNKNSNYEEWIKAFGDTVSSLILFGETKETIKTVALSLGFNNVTVVNDLEEAVLLASKLANPGESVLLSPACASWDMFKDFEERGDLFVEIVQSL